MPAKARARSVSPTFMATNTRARKEDNAEDDVAADDDAILGKYMAIAASGHANHPETTEAETAPKKEHNATVSYNASLSSRLSVVADPNSTVYKQLTTEEVDTLLSRARWREFAFNLLARGLVVYKKQTNMVYVFDHEGDIVSHATFESVSTFLRGRPVPVVPVAGSTVAHRAAISVQSSGVAPSRTDDGSAELCEAAARGEVGLRRPGRTDDGTAELCEAAAHVLPNRRNARRLPTCGAESRARLAAWRARSREVRGRGGPPGERRRRRRE